MENEKEIRLSLEELETLLKNAKLINAGEAIHEVRIEPGELVLKAVQ